MWRLISLLCFLPESCLGLTYFYGNGSYYEGEVDAMGQPSGVGQFYAKQGALAYNGTFKEGMFHGMGDWFGHHNHRYQGEFLNGVASGVGQWITNNGDIIQGEFRNHTVDGLATWTFPSGASRLKKMIGQFRRGLAMGHGTVLFKDGSRLEATFKKGYPHGDGKIFGADDSKNWEGIVWSGTPLGTVPQDVRDLFLELHRSPVRLHYDASN